MPRMFRFALIGILALPAFPALAQRMVDPSKVRPEYREAAEKRAAEQKKLAACQKEADAKKILMRDRPKFLSECFDK